MNILLTSESVLYFRWTNDAFAEETIRRMTPLCDITSQLRTRIQQAVTTACELEVTYKCSLQIFGVLCFSIDGDDDNEFVVKIQKKWCKASMHDVSDYHDVTLGVNATSVRCNKSKTFPECRKQIVQSPESLPGQHQASCDIPEAAESFPWSFRPIPSSDVTYDRNPPSLIGDVCHGFQTRALEDGDSPNIRTSYPLCPYDSRNEFPELTQQGHNVQLGNKGAFVKHCVPKDSPLACRWSRHTDENDTQAHTTNLVGSQMGKAMECDLTTLHKSTFRELSDSEGMPGCAVNHCLCGEMCPKSVVCDNRPARHVCELRPMHPDRLLSTTSTENITSFAQTYEHAGSVASAKQSRHMFIPAEVLPTSANADHTHSSMCSRKASYTDAKLYGTARTGKNRTGKIRRRTPVGRRGIRLPGCPLVGPRTMAQCFGITKNKRLTYTTEEQVELEHGGFARTMQRLLCRPPLRVDGALDGTQQSVNDDAMENVQSVDVASQDEALNLPCRAVPPEGRLSRVEFGGVDSTCDDMTNAAGNIPIAVLQRQDCHRERELDWKMHRVTCDTDKSECGTSESHIQTANTDDLAGDDLRIFLQHTGSDGGVGNINEDEHQYRSVSVTCGRTDAGKNALTEACFGMEQNMSSDIVLCKQCNKPDGTITETASGSAEVNKPLSQSDTCTDENQTTEILRKTSSCHVDTNCKIMSVPGFCETDIFQVTPCASENIQKTCEESCKTNGVMSSDLHHCNQMPPMKTCLSRSDNTCTEPVHDEMNYDTADGVSVSACKHATDDDIRPSNRMTLAVDSNSGSVDDITEDEQEGEVTDEHVSPVADDQCQGISVDSDCSHIGSDTHRNSQDPVEDSQRSDTPTHPVQIPASVTSHDHNQTPGKHVRNLFPEYSECADVTRSKDATCVASKVLLFNSFPAVRMSVRIAGNFPVSDNAETLEPVHCSSTFCSSADDLSTQQMSTVPHNDDVPIVSEGLSLECNTAAVCVKHDKDNLTRSFDEPVQKFCGFRTCVDTPDAFSSSATTRMCGAYLLSPLTRPPIHRLDRKDTGGHLPVSSLSKKSQLCRDSKHAMLSDHSKETSMQCLDGLLKDDDQENVAVAKVTGCHTESVSLSSRLSCEEPQLKTTNSDICSSEVTEAAPPDQRTVPDPSNKELHSGETGMSQLSPKSGTSGTNPLNPVPRAKSRFTAEPPCLFSVGYSTDGTESCGGSSESCSDCSGQLVNVTGSWTILPDPDTSSSLAVMSRPLVTVTSFSNIQFKDIRFDSSTDKNSARVPDDVFAVKENRRDGFPRRSQLPKTRVANRHTRWKWPANLLRTISRKSHVVTKRHLGATPESMCLEKMKVKGRWTRKWRPGSGSP